VVVHRIGHRILRITLAVPVIVDYQIACEPHQPIREISLFGVVLVKRPIYADENILRQVLCGVGTGGKAICEIKDPPGKSRNNILPRRAVARSGTLDEIRSINFGYSLYSFQKSILPKLYLPLANGNKARKLALSMIGYETWKTKVPIKDSRIQVDRLPLPAIVTKRFIGEQHTFTRFSRSVRISSSDSKVFSKESNIPAAWASAGFFRL